MIPASAIAATMAMDNPNQERQYLEAETKDGIRELTEELNREAEAYAIPEAA